MMIEPKKRGRGRPKLPKVERDQRSKQRQIDRKKTWTNISVPKDIRDKLNDYREELSERLGVDLTVAQALKYMVKNSKIT